MCQTRSLEHVRCCDAYSFARPSGESFSPGTRLRGRYRIIASLAKNGMSEVYRADGPITNSG